MVARTPPMMAEFNAMSVDVIVVAAGALAKEMMRHTSTMPIVMAVSPDPVADGIVSSLARPGGNVTGFSLQAAPEIEAKRLQLLKESAPTMVRVGYLATKKEWADIDGTSLQIAAQKLGMTVYLVEHSLTNHTEAFKSLESDPPTRLLCRTGHQIGSGGSPSLISRFSGASPSRIRGGNMWKPEV